MKRGPHQLVSSGIKYQNPWITVREDHIIRPNGQKGLYGIVEYSPGVFTVTLNEKNEIYLVKEYHYAADEETFCLPGGGIDPDETPLQAAQRELKEEAGAVAHEWVEMGCTNPHPMIVEGPQYLFLAKGAHITTGHEEEFTLQSVPFDTAVDMVMSGEIQHTASCLAILKAKLMLGKY